MDGEILSNITNIIQWRIEGFFEKNYNKTLIDALIDLSDLSFGISDLNLEKEYIFDLICKKNFDIESSQFVSELRKHYDELDCAKCFSENDELYSGNDRNYHYQSIKDFLNNEDKINKLIQLFIKELWIYESKDIQDSDKENAYTLAKEIREDVNSEVECWITEDHNTVDPSLDKEIEQIIKKPVMNNHITTTIESIIEIYLHDNWYTIDWYTKKITPIKNLVQLIKDNVIFPLIDSLISIYKGSYSVYDNSTKKELLDNFSNDTSK